MLSVLFEDLPEVHGEGLEGHAQVLLVEEGAVEPEAVELVLNISLVQPPESLQLFQSGLIKNNSKDRWVIPAMSREDFPLLKIWH